MEVDTFLGIAEEYTSDYKASGSKFFGFLFPVDNAEEYESEIKKYKTEYADATHVCSACVLGIDREYQRFSDDGEPSNSSGRPMLYALLSKGITNVGCAVVRYYGGKKLGIPGLIEAYGGTAQLCIDKAEIMELVLTQKTVCTIAPENAYLLYNFLTKTKDIKYETDATGQFIVVCPKSMTDSFRSRLKEIPTLAIQTIQ